jgi:hypothetical protein
LNDETIGALDTWFDREPSSLAENVRKLSNEGRQALVDYLSAIAALGSPEHDERYAQAIATLTHVPEADLPSHPELRRL